MAPTTAFPQDLIDELEIRSLIIKERFHRDHHEWDEWRKCYHPDPSKTHISTSVFEGTIDGFVAYTKSAISPSWAAQSPTDLDVHADSFHTITPADITIHPDRTHALCRSLGTVNFRFKPLGDAKGDDATAYDLIVETVMTSRLERSDRGWSILTRQGIYRRDRIMPVVPTELAAGFEGVVEPEEGERRQAYRCLQWFLKQQGVGSRTDVGDDHLGLDRLSGVQKFWNGERNWVLGAL